MHREICEEINGLYARKNHDYGDSFHQTFVEEGMAMARIRLGDKFNRFKTLSRSGEQKVNDESIRDTLIDLANYAIMTVRLTDTGFGLVPKQKKPISMLDFGCTPQEARSVLPNSTKTEVVMTANMREWRHFLRLRTAPAAHPDMREVAKMLLVEMQARYPAFFEDFEV